MHEIIADLAVAVKAKGWADEVTRVNYKLNPSGEPPRLSL